MDVSATKKAVEEDKSVPKKDLKATYHIIDEPQGDRVTMFLRAFAAVLKYTGYKGVLDAYSRSSAKCARCANACHLYQVTGLDRDIPCYRTNMILDIYKRYFTPGGRIKALILGDRDLTEDDIDDLKESLYRCTACRRCMLECPMGIDHGLMTHLGRYILSEMGIASKALRVSVIEQLEGKTRNTSAIPVPALVDTIEFLEEELLEMTGQEIKFPLDVEGSQYIFIPAVSDFMMEADTLMGNAALMHAVGYADKWTIGTKNYDGINYGLFYSDWALDHIIRQLVEEAERLKCPEIMIGECGHASRSAKAFVPVFGRELKRPVISCMEFACDMLKQGKLRLDPDVIKEKVTYHDPCNISRTGWIIDQPRYILKSFCKNYVEMTPNGRDNYCCGGGGGTVSIDEIHEFRMELGGRVKMEQMKATGAHYVVAPCANCKKQFRELIDYYKLDMELVGLHDLILKAIIWD
jgi:Fe-S oxidoreductase